MARQKGALNKRTRAALYDLDMQAEGRKNMRFQMSVRDNKKNPLPLRQKAAADLQGYLSPKLSTVDINQLPGGEHEEKSPEQIDEELLAHFVAKPAELIKLAKGVIDTNPSFLTDLMAAYPAIVQAYQQKVIQMPKAAQAV